MVPGIVFTIVGTMFCRATAASPGERKSLVPQAPEKYVRMSNPYANNSDAFQTGERIFASKCTRCHEQDSAGKRRGPSLSTPVVKEASPGALFWVLEKGSNQMPSFAQYPPKFRWQIVEYLQRRPERP